MGPADPPRRVATAADLLKLPPTRAAEVLGGEVVEKALPSFEHGSAQAGLSGALFGMIKFGSRTELVIPDEPGLEIVAQIGDAVKGGSTIMAKYPSNGV